MIIRICIEYYIIYTGWAKKVNYCTFSIFLLNIDQFLQFFFTNGLCEKFATQWRAHHIYYVATLSCKIKYPETYNIYSWTESLMVNF